MSIHELVKQFMERVKTLHHLLPILPEEALYVCFECDGETIIFSISKHGIQRKAELDEQKAVTVCGSKEALKSLFHGELKLQQQLRLKELTVFGSFRHMLLLESLLHLAKPYRHAS
ncbi:SCP2 sterol-binding domain-containing protein [Anoxybacillus sp. J5B_2022]|uniref:SCP2 sterol-binding domain-containing protein n=1 Tax=Anoxybacillus sp. J5B_2022 TaxID=3003246 RepID=UPI0022865454|nr:SCP2 sterol-binding domain-containing protein [Anoxybacillus sp. J5B_2022]MCZ0756584.1 SCP2 sterol-binding domain-containing protein [Anoxybacillus sp. J5B_2022]